MKIIKKLQDAIERKVEHELRMGVLCQEASLILLKQFDDRIKETLEFQKLELKKSIHDFKATLWSQLLSDNSYLKEGI